MASSTQPPLVDPTVLIADSHAPARAGVRVALELHGFLVCAEADSLAAAVTAASRERPDACLIDIELSGGGIGAATEINERIPTCSIVVLASTPTGSGLRRALRAGASGYLPKSMDPERLPFALLGVLAGEAAVPRNLVRSMIEELTGRRRPLTLAGGAEIELTRREWDILELLRERTGTEDMARTLGISTVTVRRHVSGLVRKLGAQDRATALQMTEGV